MTKAPRKRQAVAQAAPETDESARRAPTASEARAIAAARAAQDRRTPPVAMTQDTSKPGVLAVGPPHSDAYGWQSQLLETFGTVSHDFANVSAARIGTALTAKGASHPSQADTNAGMAVMAAIAPQNELEALMGEQILAAHVASMGFMHRAKMNAGESFEVAAAYVGMATKLSRTMATQIEALAKLRSGGKQQVIVKHVYVSGNAIVGDGGQAVFGGIEAHGGGGFLAKPGQGHGPNGDEAALDALGPEVWGEDASGYALSGAGDARAAALQAARRESDGSAHGEGERPLQTRALHEGASTSPRTGARGDR